MPRVAYVFCSQSPPILFLHAQRTLHYKISNELKNSRYDLPLRARYQSPHNGYQECVQLELSPQCLDDITVTEAMTTLNTIKLRRERSVSALSKNSSITLELPQCAVLAIWKNRRRISSRLFRKNLSLHANIKNNG
jgi:hypothetical protein